MVSDSKTRVQVTMSMDMAESLKQLADASGVTVSQYCAVVLGQHVSSTNRVYEMMKNMLGDGFAELLEQKGESTLK